ncbi:hypothetical protein BV898_06737 [Hypsibius exemplaris]|uniref:Tc1-like transposase DDE domain-containing protein n=1 Tax=Hypsibius exemplaris TaxID=2072580 RepID=A0A1W0WVS7_HYPEX|nr:hypothetical protein BV898_06737 [Hypsibius exemplaris]
MEEVQAISQDSFVCDGFWRRFFFRSISPRCFEVRFQPEPAYLQGQLPKTDAEDLPYGLEANSAILYQDKAPCHAAATVQAFLKEKMPCFIPNADIPPNSPDLNPLDYCVWSLLKERVNKHGFISSFDRLAKILKDEWEAISQQVIQDSINSWMSRVRKVEKARGFHIE